MRQFRSCLRVIVLVSIYALMTAGLAQGQDDIQWSTPQQLSGLDVDSSGAYMVADNSRRIHAFWIEHEVGDQNYAVMYSSFNGEAWSEPNDIHIVQPGGWAIGDISPYVDSINQIHLLTIEGNNGPAFYQTASADNAWSAASWSKPIPLDIKALFAKLLVDSRGVIHILYASFWSDAPGVYYVRSVDGGQTWSRPYWLNPDTRSGLAPNVIDAALGDDDSIHVVWSDLSIEEVVDKQVRYANSYDGGDSWSQPIMIDEADESPEEVRMARPSILISQGAVHVIWAGTEKTNREQRMSTDGGTTWTDPVRIFGDLLGQALGDGTGVDDQGRLHFASHIRDPSAIWHAIWQDGSWVQLRPVQPFPDRPVDQKELNIHYVRLAIRDGQQVVIAFKTMSDPSAPLYVFHQLVDVPLGDPINRNIESMAPSDVNQLVSNDIQSDSLDSPTAETEAGSEDPVPPDRTILSSQEDEQPADRSTLYFGGILPVLLIVSVVAIRRAWTSRLVS